MAGVATAFNTANQKSAPDDNVWFMVLQKPERPLRLFLRSGRRGSKIGPEFTSLQSVKSLLFGDDAAGLHFNIGGLGAELAVQAAWRVYLPGRHVFDGEFPVLSVADGEVRVGIEHGDPGEYPCGYVMNCTLVRAPACQRCRSNPRPASKHRGWLDSGLFTGTAWML